MERFAVLGAADPPGPACERPRAMPRAMDPRRSLGRHGQVPGPDGIRNKVRGHRLTLDDARTVAASTVPVARAEGTPGAVAPPKGVNALCPRGRVCVGSRAVGRVTAPRRPLRGIDGTFSDTPESADRDPPTPEEPRGWLGRVIARRRWTSRENRFLWIRRREGCGPPPWREVSFACSPACPRMPRS